MKSGSSNLKAESSPRSILMKAVRRKDTNPELVTRKVLHADGFRYRLHQKGLPGTPDIVFASRKKVIFVNGCFWHRHHGCRKATMPKTNVDFWNSKFEQNVFRDHAKNAQLRQAGYEVLTVWECETTNRENLRNKLRSFLCES